MKPVCFMVMPFRTKAVTQAESGAPLEVNFDRLWDAAFRPAIEQLGYLPVRADLESATEYTLAMQNAGAPHGVVEFAALPVALAHATLDRLEASAAATKIGRSEVFGIVRQVNQSIAQGKPALRRHPPAATARGRMSSMFSLLLGNRRTT